MGWRLTYIRLIANPFRFSIQYSDSVHTIVLALHACMHVDMAVYLKVKETLFERENKAKCVNVCVCVCVCVGACGQLQHSQ